MSHNPLNLNGIDFVEFTSSDPHRLHNLFIEFGFSKIAKHKEKNIDLYVQAGITFMLNYEASSFADQFQKLHGPSISAMGWRVKDARQAYDEALSRGARSSTFVDNCNESLKLTMNNCKKLNLMKKSYFLNYDLTKKIKENKSFGLFFLDPPYKDEIINKSLELLFKKKWIINDSIGIIESSKDQEIEKFEFINMIKKKKMGISSFSFIRVI